MGSTSIRITYRPLRIGFLVPQGATELVGEAAKVNSLLWGGINNPIIPVGDDADRVKGLVNTFSVDALFSLDDSIDLDRFYDKYSQIRYHQMIGLLPFGKEEWQSRGDDSHCLDILSAMNHIWSERTHAWPQEKEGRHVCLRWDSKDPERTVFEVLFGAFPREESLFERHLMRILHSSAVALSLQDAIPDTVIDRQPLISLTSYLLRYNAHQRSSPSLYLGRANDFGDLVTFWNLRAAGLPLFFCNVANMERWGSVTRSFLRRCDRAHVKSDWERTGVIAYCNSLSGTEIDAFRQWLDCEVETHIHDLSKHQRLSPDFPIEPTVPFLQEEATLAVVETKERRYRMSGPLPSPRFLDANDLRASAQRFVAVLSPTTEFEYPFHTIKVPFLRDLVEDFGRTMLVDPFESTMQKEGIGRIVCRVRQTIDIYPLPYSALVLKIIGRSGIDAKPSQPGVLATTMLQQLGGMHEMWAFKIRGVRRLTKAFKADESFNKEVAKRHIADQGSYKKYAFFLDRTRTTPEYLFSHLVERGLLRAGLEFKCDNCRLSNWLPLDRIGDMWTCQYCGESQQTARLLCGSSGKWRFRRSGLLGKDNNQEGAIPVLLAALVFESLFTDPGMVWVPGLKLAKDNEINCEIDLCVLQYGRHEQASWSLQSRLEIGIAECKDEGGEITEQDVSNLVSIHRQFDQKEIRSYLILSKTADNFTPAELDRFRALKHEQIPLILLTNLELEASYPYIDARGEAPSTPMTLEEMSWISDRRYLQKGE
jgi:hypothetical protein